MRSAARPRSRPVVRSPRPAVYIAGEFIGGCDTAIEMYKSGELREMLVEAGVKEKE